MKNIPALLVVLLVLASASLTGTAASTHAKQTETRIHPALSDPDSLRVIVDEIMAGFMDSLNIAGATVAVVRDGQLFFSGGYGLADVRRRVPVDPGRTLFRIGSVTKLFTW
ncbi:MAG: class A beta-lactamase-related serine hydrolase, partial [Balneolaceae bacterium]